MGFKEWFPPSVIHAVIVITVIVMIALLCKWLGEYKKKSYPYSESYIQQVRHLITESARYSAYSLQDTNPAIALIHSTYALAYMNAARMLMPDDQLMNHCNIHAAEYVMILTDAQQKAFQALSQVCPNVQPEGPYALFTGYIA